MFYLNPIWLPFFEEKKWLKTEQKIESIFSLLQIYTTKGRDRFH